MHALIILRDYIRDALGLTRKQIVPVDVLDLRELGLVDKNKPR